jgi:hypothetical protein
MQFDGSKLYLSSYSGGSVSSNTTLITINEASGTSAVFDYYVSNGAGSRAGTVIAVWDGAATAYTDYSTPDLGTSTTDISFSTSADGTNVYFNVNVVSGTWTVKAASRIIF